MKKSLLFLIIVCACIFMSGCFGNNVDNRVDMSPRLITMSSELDTKSIVSAVSAATVSIQAKSATVEAIGSGVCVASGGYILTNNHVIDGAKLIKLYLANGEVADASVLWKDSSMDIAILKCNRNLPYVEMSSSKNLEKGQDVIAIGTPLSLQFEQTVTKGIVSALNRTIDIENDNGSTSYHQNLIQHDASINPGNSGGPLFNMRGQVVGINTLKASEAEGLGFAIPIEICVPIINRLTTGASFETPYLGIYGFDATTAKYYDKTAVKDGVYVLNVAPNSPCEIAGIKIGDVITKIGDNSVKTLLDLRVELYNYQSGDNLTFEIDRNGEIQTLNLQL